jgi:hypothetical protein
MIELLVDIILSQISLSDLSSESYGNLESRISNRTHGLGSLIWHCISDDSHNVLSIWIAASLFDLVERTWDQLMH